MLVVVAPDGSSGAFLVIDWPQVWFALGTWLQYDYININRESLSDRMPYQVINTEKTFIDPISDLGTIAPVTTYNSINRDQHGENVDRPQVYCELLSLQ